MNALKQRAQAILSDTSIDAQSRAIIRYGLETHDPWLARLVSRVDAGENIVDSFGFSQTPATNDESSGKEDIEALARMICGAGDQSAAALLVLMGKLANSANPRALANMAKHFAFAHCGELNLYGMLDAQIAAVEAELFGRSK
jgi:hypothetical protein